MKKNTGLCLIRHIILNCSGVLRLLLSAVLLTFTFLPHSHQKLMAYWRPQVQGQVFRNSCECDNWRRKSPGIFTLIPSETLRWAWPELCYDFTFIPQVPVYRGWGAAGEYVCTRQHWSTALTGTHNNSRAVLPEQGRPTDDTGVGPFICLIRELSTEGAVEKNEVKLHDTDFI